VIDKFDGEYTPYQVMIRNLACNGNESDISLCQSDDWDTGYENCPYSGSYQSVGVKCCKFYHFFVLINSLIVTCVDANIKFLYNYILTVILMIHILKFQSYNFDYNNIIEDCILFTLLYILTGVCDIKMNNKRNKFYV
jgi:hypothetical protein